MENDNFRPDPDALLKVANETEGTKGKLTIFFGAAPGVGKTYSMLQEAQNLRKEGVDIVVGYVEPHKRKETEALLQGLPAIPSKVISYKGLNLSEPDLDAILLKKPRIVIMDELAHTNAPSSRHEKRYQDVEEILKAGIDVYTTLNVQHLESVNDVVFRITGVQMKETIPDVTFVEADEVKIIDLPPKELLKRLAEGKVYVGQMAQQAVQRFFTEGNLTALRELALRCIASNVDKEMDEYRKIKAVKEPWPVTDKILVGVFSSPSAEQLVRAAFRLSSELNANWTALHVVTEKDKVMTEQEKSWLTKAIDLAKELGAEIAWVKGNNVVDEIIRYAQDHNVTKIVVGKPYKIRFNIFFLWRILKETRGMDVFLFSHEFRKGILKERRIVSAWKGIWAGGLWVLASAGIGQIFRENLSETNMLFLMLLPVVVVSINFKRRVALFSAGLSVVLFDYLFVKPYYTFAINDVQYFLSFIAVGTVAFSLSHLASRLRFQVKELRSSEAQNAALYDLTKDLLVIKDSGQLAETIVKHIRSMVPCEAGVFFFDSKQEILAQKTSPGFVLNDKEMAVVLWVYKNGEPAGPGTKTLREAQALYLPIKGEKATQAVIGIKLNKREGALTADSQLLLETVGRIGALVLKEKYHSAS
jgi:two-component system, OmpR family, sensor histidine kinase KdpD